MIVASGKGGVEGEAGKRGDCLLSRVTGVTSAAILVSHISSRSSLMRSELMVKISGRAASGKNGNRLGDVIISKADGMSEGAMEYGFQETVQEDQFMRTGRWTDH